LLETISDKYQSLLGSNLTGIYGHGSMAFDCFSWERSDIDFIVVVENAAERNIKLIMLDIENRFSIVV
jgi:streptomycin 3"-adenylyltransferase